MSGELVVGRLGDLWKWIAVLRDLTPHIQKIMDKSAPTRERLECALHVVQIIAKETPTTLDDQFLAWLAENDLDDAALDFIADILDKIINGQEVPPMNVAGNVGNVPIWLLIEIAMAIYELFKDWFDGE